MSAAMPASNRLRPRWRRGHFADSQKPFGPVELFARQEALDPIAKAKKPPKVVLEREIYGGAQRALWEQLWNLPESAKSVLLIGHNPALQGSRAGARPRRLEQAASVGRWKISDGCNGEFPLRWSMEGVGAARRCARLIYNTKGNCGIIQRSQGARRAEMSVKSVSRRTPAHSATPHYLFA